MALLNLEGLYHHSTFAQMGGTLTATFSIFNCTESFNIQEIYQGFDFSFPFPVPSWVGDILFLPWAPRSNPLWKHLSWFFFLTQLERHLIKLIILFENPCFGLETRSPISTEWALKTRRSSFLIDGVWGGDKPHIQLVQAFNVNDGFELDFGGIILDKRLSLGFVPMAIRKSNADTHNNFLNKSMQECPKSLRYQKPFICGSSHPQTFKTSSTKPFGLASVFFFFFFLGVLPLFIWWVSSKVLGFISTYQQQTGVSFSLTVSSYLPIK